MGIFKRLKDLSLANINSMIDKAEDPVKMMDQFIRDMNEDISEVTSAVATQIATAKKFKNKIAEDQAKVEEYAAGAEKAILAGKEDVARRALEAKKNHQEAVTELTPQYETAQASADRMQNQLREMRDEYEKLKSQRDTLAARMQAAEATKKVNQVMSGFGTDSARAGFERMADKVNQAEAEAQATGELAAGNKSLDKELAEINKDSGVDDELAALKAKLGK